MDPTVRHRYKNRIQHIPDAYNTLINDGKLNEAAEILHKHIVKTYVRTVGKKNTNPYRNDHKWNNRWCQLIDKRRWWWKQHKQHPDDTKIKEEWNKAKSACNKYKINKKRERDEGFSEVLYELGDSDPKDKWKKLKRLIGKNKRHRIDALHDIQTGKLEFGSEKACQAMFNFQKNLAGTLASDNPQREFLDPEPIEEKLCEPVTIEEIEESLKK